MTRTMGMFSKRLGLLCEGEEIRVNEFEFDSRARENAREAGLEHPI
jgi:hypothetical protein